MIVVDASVWSSVLIPQDVHYSVRRGWLGRWTQDCGRVAAPVLLVAEVGTAVARRTGSVVMAHKAISDLLHDPVVNLVSIDHQLGAEAARLAADLRLRGADATYVAVAQRLGIPLVTWDREQLERASSAISVRTPGISENGTLQSKG